MWLGEACELEAEKRPPTEAASMVWFYFSFPESRLGDGDDPKAAFLLALISLRTITTSVTTEVTAPKTPERVASVFDISAPNVLPATRDVSSLDVAHHFEKLHHNVLRSIEAIECSKEFRALNFEASSYSSVQNKQIPIYRLTRDGFTMLVMGFTGSKAAYWRERYIQAFNMMEAELLKRHIIHAETRGRSKTIRVVTTDSYKEHGATEWFHYSNNTDAIYEIVHGGTAAQLRRKWGLPRKANVRDHLTTDQLNTIIQIEGAITLQLEARKITNPADQLRVVRHVALSYRNLIEATLPLVGSPKLAGTVNPPNAAANAR
jgi:Rha family phage regulatory protein